MDLKETNNLVREAIVFPVKYNLVKQTIWDSKGKLVCGIRGWGRKQSINESVERQDEIGEVIAKLLNESRGEDEKLKRTNGVASVEK